MSSTLYNPTLPLCTPIPFGVRLGQLIRIQGTVHATARCFAINLQLGPSVNPRDDIALHFSPVFTAPPRVVRNSLVNQRWAAEESHGGFPFIVGSSFELLIMAEVDGFRLAINGTHFVDFRHRLPLGRLTHCAIDGDLCISLVDFDSGSAAAGRGGSSSTALGFVPSAPSAMPSSSALPYPVAGGAGGPIPYPMAGVAGVAGGGGMPSMPPDPGAYPAQPGYGPSMAGPGYPPAHPGGAPPAYPQAAHTSATPAYPSAYSTDGQHYGGGGGGGYPTAGPMFAAGGAAAAAAYPGAQLLYGTDEQYKKDKKKRSNPIGIPGMDRIPGIRSIPGLGALTGGGASGAGAGGTGGRNVAGLAAGVGAAAVGAYALSKVGKPFKLKKMYKHKYKKPKGFKHKGFKHKGWGSSSSSSSEEE